ncbi:NXPE family member 4-like isoform X2 [Lampetra planeri]
MTTKMVLLSTVIFGFLLPLIFYDNKKLLRDHHHHRVKPKFNYQTIRGADTLSTAERNKHALGYSRSTWHLPISTNPMLVTSASESVVTIVNRREEHFVGESLHVKLEMRDATGKPKSHGGDFVMARIYNADLGAAASASVTDHSDGTYTVEFRILWPGESRLEIILVHPGEAVGILENARESVPNRVSFWGTFVAGEAKKTAVCELFLNTTQEICNFTDERLGEGLICEKPSGFPCYSIHGYTSFTKYWKVFTQDERRLFSRDHILVPMRVPYHVHASITDELKRLALKKPGKGRQQPRLAVDIEHNISLQWYCHAYPLITQAYTVTQDARYIAQRIDDTFGGSHTVVAISLGAHFVVFPVEVFRRRMRNIGAAVARLLLRNPKTKVVVKLANTRDSSNLEFYSNWNTFRMNQVTMEVFKDMNVAFVDAWDMTASINSTDVHPNRMIVKNEVDLFLSFVC